MRLFNLKGAPTPEVKNSDMTLDELISRLAERQSANNRESITPAQSLKSPTVFAIVNNTANAMATLPFSVVRHSDNRRDPDPMHPVSKLLSRKPNSWQSAPDYWRCVVTNLMTVGEFLAIKLTGGGQVRQLQPVPRGAWEVKQQDNLSLVYRVTLPSGAQRDYAQSQVHHIRNGLSLDGVSTLSPVEQVARAIWLEILAEQYGQQLFGGGAIPNVVIKHPGRFSDQDAANRFKASWQKAFGGGKRGTAVLEEGLDVQLMQLNNEESQFLETRKLQRSVIAGAFGIPPHVVGDYERATFSNVEQMSLNYVVYSIVPILVSIEKAIARDLFSEPEQDTMQPKFKVQGLLRGDMKTRAEVLKIWLEHGIISPNEARTLEDMNPREDEDGDAYYTPLNFESSNDEEPREPEPAAPAPVDPVEDDTDADGVAKLRRISGGMT